MQELITIHNMDFDGTEQQTVNARELHNFLEIGKDFSTWVKAQIDRAGFLEGADFVKTQDLSSPKKGSAKSRPQLRIEYHFTLNAAKEISMMSNSSKGKEARLYFIKCEKDLMEIKRQQAISGQSALPDFTNPAIAARAWAEQYEKRQALEIQIKEDQPKVELADTFLSSRGQFLIRQVAKSMGIGTQFLFGWLRTHKWIMKTNEPYATHCTRGYLIPKPHTYEASDGFNKTSFTTYITPKGVKKIHEKLILEGIIPKDRQIQFDFLTN